MIWIVAVATIDFSLIQVQLPVESKGGQLSPHRANTSPCVFDGDLETWRPETVASRAQRGAWRFLKSVTYLELSHDSKSSKGESEQELWVSNKP